MLRGLASIDIECVFSTACNSSTYLSAEVCFGAANFSLAARRRTVEKN